MACFGCVSCVDDGSYGTSRAKEDKGTLSFPRAPRDNAIYQKRMQIEVLMTKKAQQDRDGSFMNKDYSSDLARLHVELRQLEGAYELDSKTEQPHSKIDARNKVLKEELHEADSSTASTVASQAEILRPIRLSLHYSALVEGKRGRCQLKKSSMQYELTMISGNG